MDVKMLRLGDSSMRLIRSQYRGEHKFDHRYGNARSVAYRA
jgi:hypothetical protein